MKDEIRVYFNKLFSVVYRLVNLSNLESVSDMFWVKCRKGYFTKLGEINVFGIEEDTGDFHYRANLCDVLSTK